MERTPIQMEYSVRRKLFRPCMMFYCMFFNKNISNSPIQLSVLQIVATKSLFLLSFSIFISKSVLVSGFVYVPK